eukprot:scaffold1607_cov417-Prasinococcus_capsulatus_cf.AAC.2
MRVAFQMYDLGNTSTIEPQEVREMLASVLSERSELSLAPDDIDRIVDSTFKKVRAVPALQMYGRHGAWADIAGDGVISFREWEILCREHPKILGFMTLESLKDLTKQYPQFMFKSTASQL